YKFKTKEEALKIIKDDPLSSYYIPDGFLEDRSFVVELLNLGNLGDGQLTSLFSQVSTNLRNEKEIIDLFLEKGAYALHMLMYGNSETIKNYKEVVLRAMKQTSVYSIIDCYNHISDELKKDKEIAGYVMQKAFHKEDVIKILPEEVKEYREIAIQIACYQNFEGNRYFEYLPKHFFEEKEFVVNYVLHDDIDFLERIPKYAQNYIPADVKKEIETQASELVAFSNKEIKLADITNVNLTEDWFFVRVLEIVKDRTLKYFEEIAEDCSEEDIVDIDIQEEINKKIKTFQKRIEEKRNLALEEINKQTLGKIDKIKHNIEDFEV
ncbi:hypothetical protein J6Q66_09460, partial [bacterium]|nr:hypothetical protein [bacterium]